MTRTLSSVTPVGSGRHLMGEEPLIFHCNHYNYWLQHTVRLGGGEMMDPLIVEAARASVSRLLGAAAGELGLEGPAARLELARDVFAELGFGLIDFSACGPEGGTVRTPVSHYGDTFASACPGELVRVQNLFDQGFALAALGLAYGETGFGIAEVQCKSLGASEGIIVVDRSGSAPRFESPGAGAVSGTEVPPPWSATSVDEGAILEALSGLSFSGNEEGLTPRFGVMLTHHLANFYNRISFEFLAHMRKAGLGDEGETLLVDAGHRCAFNTFGGIMISPEWYAVVHPQLENQLDWVHGMVAVVNALGWGVWRVHELSEERLVVRIYDDYESCGWLGMYDRAERPVSFLATGGVAGIMNLVFPGKIAEKPELDAAFYARIFESEGRYFGRQLKSLAMGDPYTEIVAEKR